MSNVTDVIITESRQGIVEEVAATYDILTLEEAKYELNIVDTNNAAINAQQDADVQAKIEEVQVLLERSSSRTLGSNTQRTMKFYGWPTYGVRFPFPPLKFVDQVHYIDVDGVQQVLPPTQYEYVTSTYGVGRLLWLPSFTPPELHPDTMAAVWFVFTSGTSGEHVGAKRAAKHLLKYVHDGDLDEGAIDRYGQAAIAALTGEEWGWYA